MKFLENRDTGQSTALNILDLGLVFLDKNCRSLGADREVRGRGVGGGGCAPREREPPACAPFPIP